MSHIERRTTLPIKLSDLDEERRCSILNAALKEFAIKGYDNASTNIIARESGISKPLMFHYIGSKQELFLYVFDYFSELLNKEYYRMVSYDNPDILERLHQSFMLQLKLLKKHPWVFELNRLNNVTGSEEVNRQLEHRNTNKNTNCFPSLFESMDKSLFRAGLDIEKCKQIIFLSCTGFSSQMLNNIRNSDYDRLDYSAIEKAMDNLFADLKYIFYRNKTETEV